jgi:hypothetical protein
LQSTLILEKITAKKSDYQGAIMANVNSSDPQKDQPILSHKAASSIQEMPPGTVKNKFLSSPRFKPGEDEKSVEPDFEINLDSLQGLIRTFGTHDMDLLAHFMRQLINSTPGLDSPAVKLNHTVPLLHGLRPRDELEAMLAIQMVGIHNCVMECLRQAMHPDQVDPGVEANIHRSTALAKVFLSQVETLQKYRGQGSKQTVTVEHVQVQPGGQAIVGTVHHLGPQGGGDEPD